MMIKHTDRPVRLDLISIPIVEKLPKEIAT